MSVHEIKRELDENLVKTLARYDISAKEFSRFKNQFSVNTSDHYIIRMMLGSKARELVRHGHLNEALDQHNLLSTFIAVEEKSNPFETLRNMHNLVLRKYSRLGYKHVRIINCGEGGCLNCRKKHGQIIDISKAMKEMPLPIPSCSFDLYRNGHSYCRCSYEPVDQSTNINKKKQKKDYRSFKYVILPIAIIIIAIAIILYYINLYS